MAGLDPAIHVLPLQRQSYLSVTIEA